MATADPAQAETPQEPTLSARGRWARLRHWLRHDLVYLLGSTLLHAVLLVVVGLLVVRPTPPTRSEAPSFDASTDPDAEAPAEAPLEHFELGDTPLEPSDLSAEPLSLPAQLEQSEQKNDDNPIFTERGGGTPQGFVGEFSGLSGLSGDPSASGSGPAAGGFGLGNGGKGTGTAPGSGGSGTGLGGRGTGMRKALVGRYGGTKQSERAVTAALNWLARHQMANGSWSLREFPLCCKDKNHVCTGVGSLEEAGGATALGLLPFLAAGYTHQSQGVYRKTVSGGLSWLIRHQGADGDLRMGATMYSHGLATIALCEAAALSRDSTVAIAAQKAIAFLEAAQHPETGGWRYVPRSPGDTSVLGWQVMALKSAQMAGLRVQARSLQGASYFLDSVASGAERERFAYMPQKPPGPAMTAVGLLCRQYLGMERESPTMEAGVDYLMTILPDPTDRNVYHWYYATQVIHNYSGPKWDLWNRKMRKVLIDSQVREGCAAGSWDPAQPVADAYAREGGRLMVTSLSVLTLEIYYRYLPLYKFEISHHAAGPTETVEPKAAEPADKEPPENVPAEVPEPAGADEGDSPLISEPEGEVR